MHLYLFRCKHCFSWQYSATALLKIKDDGQPELTFTIDKEYFEENLSRQAGVKSKADDLLTQSRRSFDSKQTIF